MLFNSLAFVIFFPVVTYLYFILPHSYRWFFLLVASCIFYMWFIPKYLFILFVLIVVDYFAGIWIEEAKYGRRRYLVLSILTTIAALFVFKYFNFFSASFCALAHFFGLNYSPKVLGLILPIGLSFHTFQSLSYVIEVYKGRQKAERHFGIYALYVMFYPQLVAGPIERPQNLLHQFYEYHTFDYERVVDGLKLMTWGMFKKIVIADRLALLVNQVYGDTASYQGPIFFLATFFFAFQIYCDFSGYSDIAIGAAQVMGFKLMDNFNRPYFAKFVAEFWKRWHISLASWFRDYLYIPLGGNRCSVSRWRMNIFATFLLSGLWHGANWTFVIWGGLNAFFIVVEGKIRQRMGKFGVMKGAQILMTFGLICFAWIFFRAASLHDALYIISQLPLGWSELFSKVLAIGLPKFLFFEYGIRIKQLFISFLLIIFLIGVQLIQSHKGMRHMVSDKPAWIRWGLYYLLVLGIIFLGQFGKNQFIYFQF